MATLGELQKAELTANDNLNEKTSVINSTLNSIVSNTKPSEAPGGFISRVGYARMGAKEVDMYDFIGINVNGVPAMEEAIDHYCSEVKALLEEIEEKTDPHSAFAGQFVEELKTFIEAVKNSCLSLVDSLGDFKKDLNSAAEAMKTADVNLGQSISSDTSSVNSTMN